MAVTAASVALRARQRADMLNTQFVTDAELVTIVQQAHDEVWRDVSEIAPDWFTAKAGSDSTLTGGTEANARFALPTDFMADLRVERSPDTAMRYNLPKFGSLDPRPWPFTPARGPLPFVAYKIQGSYVVIEPYESAAGVYRLWYVQSPAAISTNLDQRMEVFADLIVIRAAIICRDKEESDTTSAWREYGIAREQAMSVASRRSSPSVVPDPGW